MPSSMSLYVCNTIQALYKQLHLTNNEVSFVKVRFSVCLLNLPLSTRTNIEKAKLDHSVPMHSYFLNPIHILLFINFKVAKHYSISSCLHSSTSNTLYLRSIKLQTSRYPRLILSYKGADNSLARPVMKQVTFPAFYGTCRFIATFTRVHHLSLP